jgi:hypothetical protein
MTYRFLVIVAFLFSFPEAPVMAMDVTGTWEYYGPAESGLWLKTKQRGNHIRFQLELQRGAPSYNSGWIEGEFELRDKSGSFQRNTDSGVCEIAFRFYPSRVEIRKSGDEFGCKFGYNAVADGVLLRKSRNSPQFSDGDPRFGQ